MTAFDLYYTAPDSTTTRAKSKDTRTAIPSPYTPREGKTTCQRFGTKPYKSPTISGGGSASKGGGTFLPSLQPLDLPAYAGERGFIIALVVLVFSVLVVTRS